MAWVAELYNYAECNTVKPLLSGPPIERTPSIKRTLSQVPKLTSYISLYDEALFSGHLFQAEEDTKINCIWLISIDNSSVGLGA